jgi:hypothetical protein
VLEAVLFGHKVQCIRSVPEISKKFLAGNSTLTTLHNLLKSGIETPVSQFRDNDNSTVNDLNTFKIQEKRMTQIPNSLQCLEFRFGLRPTQATKQNLDGLGKTTGTDPAPDFSKSAEANAFLKSITADLR